MTKVVVMGGGIAGLTAAHELAERGFEVVLIEKTGIPGGKARSKPVMPVGSSPWSDLPRFDRLTPGQRAPWVPGEHGFRFFPGFYKHVVESMERIPTPGGGTAADHLVPTSRCGLTQYGKPRFTVPARFPRTPADAGGVLAAVLNLFSHTTELTAAELGHFGARIWQILTSCAERRLGRYEKISWWKFIGAAERSPAYRKFLASGITRSLVAAHAETASTRTIGNIFIQLVLDIVDPLVGTSDRVLDGPTNQTWIYPWLVHVRNLGATYLAETSVREILHSKGRVTGVLVEGANGVARIDADYFVCAVPAERAVPLLSRELLDADPSLSNIGTLASQSLEWMNGVQFYLRRPLEMPRGHMIHIDTEWALTTISQLDFWRPETMERYGNDEVRAILSVDVSDWDAPAPCGRSATEHTREGVGHEVWRQLKRSLNSDGTTVLRDEDLIGWYLDSCVHPDPGKPGRVLVDEPLLVNLVDTWKLRPEARTAIPNFFLASDYVRTHTDLATMEGANEAARRAVNGILDADGHSGPRCRIWPLHEPPILAPLRQYDAMRYGLGLEWDANQIAFASEAVMAADPALTAVARELAVVQPLAAMLESMAEGAEAVLPVQAAERELRPVIAHLQAAAETVERAIPSAAMEATAYRRGREMRAGAADEAGSNGTPHQPPHPAQEESPGPLPFADRLDWYRTQAFATLADVLPANGPELYLYAPIRDFLERPSKGLRPALCIATCRAFGGRTTDALTSAAGLELLHNAFLVHDDIEDGSEYRRGKPTLHRSLGTPLAVNIGDAMNALAMRQFRRNILQLGPTVALRIFDEVDHMLLESLEGQALELGWVRDNDCAFGIDDYLRMILKKTAWYSFIHPMRIGAMVADAQDRSLDRFHAFGFLLGAAFQIQDDILNLTGDLELYGKEIGGDLWEGKRTLPLWHALTHASPRDRAHLVGFLTRRRDGRLTREVHSVQRLLEELGSITWAADVATAFARAAEESLPIAFSGAAASPDLDFIRSLVDYLVRREV